MNKALAELIKISNMTGKDPTLVQGGGGNTSVKTDDGKYMYIKASGTALKDMSSTAGWRRLRLDMVLGIIKDNQLDRISTGAREAEVVNRLLLACEDEIIGNARPSVEAHLHAILDKCVIHLHPVVVLSYACAKNGWLEIEKLFRDARLPPLWVSFANPGLALAKKVAKLVGDYQSRFGGKPSVIFLEKHGLFISANSPDTAQRLLNQVIKRCARKLKLPKADKTKSVSQKVITDIKLGIRRAFYEATGQYAVITHFDDDAIAAFWRQKNAAKWLSAGALIPDELVYTNGPPMWVENWDYKKTTRQLTSKIEKEKKPPNAFLVKGVGLFVAGTGKNTDTVRDTVKNSLVVRVNASRLGGIVSLNRQEQDFVNKWEAEAFRKNMAAGSVQGELHGQIAVVTGAGSGLGRSIAIGLARAGAIVGLFDVDTKSAGRTQAIITEELPDAQTIVIGCDVTSETSVDKAFDALLKEWGGLDILVNAAGLAPPYGLIDMPVDKWRLAIDVNLTGYFLMAKAAAKIMIQQRMGGSIINLSSKSGLEPSKNNTAYTTTKAGELAMARGWAMELGEHGIRVNCVCPGNVFEGSKIWNPEYIKICAKKYGIRPEDVIPYYVNKTALRREIKGQDIADSIVFLCSDKARTITGQTLVADSGQVMVR
jgi:NAD(P)-dependent dehydrogenase (short-subunit alcohol dehydrogenase family)/rhamnose utilization protein RhaD (predicted bifunctional aldolase and dehydrogenase)